MIGLYLLAAHMVGDFVLQTRWQAAWKLHRFSFRYRHVLAYCLPFVPVAVVYSSGAIRAGAFMVLLFWLHLATDSRRFRVTLGDYVVWMVDWRRDPMACRSAWQDELFREMERMPSSVMAVDLTDAVVSRPTSNPWGPLPIVIDQTLHLCQLAVLGGVFLHG